MVSSTGVAARGVKLNARSLAIKCRFKNAWYFAHIRDVMLEDDMSTFTQYSD